jgi:LuxR family maltose regulon positive regulatory protein
VRSGAGVPGFGRPAPGRATAPLDALDAMTALMGELGALEPPLTLMIDQADTLPAASLRLLAYLLHNAPPAMRIVLAARSSLKALAKDLLAYGQCDLRAAPRCPPLRLGGRVREA